MVRAVTLVLTAAVTLLLLVAFPVLLGEARRQVPGWSSTHRHDDLVLGRDGRGNRCVAHEGGSMCAPLWWTPWFAAGWYEAHVRRLVP
jgi:hypothetical protein